MYQLHQYLDPETNRYRWAVIHAETRVWYFARRYGKKAAERLQFKLMASEGYI